MCNRHSVVSRASAVTLPYLIFLCVFPGFISSAVVTLKSIEIYNTHQWVPRNPEIYFQCLDENKTLLPDVQEADVPYSFKGEESWQPLTELLTKKCKRCGLYQVLFMSDYTYEEWELCSSDFAAPDGKYTRFKEEEFSALFECKGCLSLVKDSPNTEELDTRGGKKHFIASMLITIASIVAVVVVSVAAFKYWQKKKRQQEQARFLKLFEEDDDMDDELGLKEMTL
ncbi:hypothetical protein V2J09_004259 [Rumex salicifolius]